LFVLNKPHAYTYSKSHGIIFIPELLPSHDSCIAITCSSQTDYVYSTACILKICVFVDY